MGEPKPFRADAREQRVASRVTQTSALIRLAAIAGHVPAMPLPDAINTTVPTRAALAAVAVGLAANGTPYQWREGCHVQELIVPLGGLTYRVRWHGPAIPTAQQTAATTSSPSPDLP
ncbi:hypothetical protein GCM10017673_40050 [Streptosporangium violaceochromogenes]|nr:hypothetical protein GCM10017673_40050 [Streptosporangium violaceochromogenes]